MLTRLETSLWRAQSPGIETDPPPIDFARRRFDIVVAGAGITGLTTALLFARAGLSVAVLEARSVGAVTTGNSTAKLSVLQGTRLSDILAHTTLRTAKAYVEANREGRDWLIRYCEEHGVPVQRRDAFTYAGTPDAADAVRREYEATRRLDLPTDLVEPTELPFETHGAVRLADQAQVDPMLVLAALAEDVRDHGGVIYEMSNVRRVRASKPVEVETNRGVVLAGKLILATGMPILDRGLYWAKVVPQRSYAMAFRVPGESPKGMYISADTPTRSLRTATERTLPESGDTGGEVLIVGGNGHVTGRDPSPQAQFDDLERWTGEHFPGAVLTHRWSAQDYEPAGRIPYVGWLPRGRRRIFMATGYNKWGMCNSVAASLTLASDILGGSIPWARTLHHRITSPQDVATGIGANAAVAVHLVRGYLNAWQTPPPATPPAEGQATVTHNGLRPVGVCTVAGVTSRVSARCPHLGGVVTWNDAESSWDCPLHGSRFAADGARLEGPARWDLPRR